MVKMANMIPWAAMRLRSALGAVACLALVLTAGATRIFGQAPKVSFRDFPHNYWSSPLEDPFSRFLRLKGGQVLDGPTEQVKLQSLLRALDIPQSSQLLVYSATSLQSGLILPSNPRAIYFNENTYVGYVPGGRVEVASIDPSLGPIFYVSQPAPGGNERFTRSERCMNCHAGRTSAQLPGMVAESVICTPTGASLDGFRRETVGHQIPLSERLGGWHVTGSPHAAYHLGNLVGEAVPGGYRTLHNPPGAQFDFAHYPNKTSDFLSHLLHEHQLGFHNLVTLAAYRTREALAKGQGHLLEGDANVLNDISARLTRYILFADEAPLPANSVIPDPEFLQDFRSKRIATKEGDSLRDFDLNTRIFRYRCSYMIYTEAFRSLPTLILERFTERLLRALSEDSSSEEFSYLPKDEKQSILRILTDTNALKRPDTR
jgi:hypothetical protein